MSQSPRTPSKFVSAEERRSVFKKLKHEPENRICFDCPQRNPTWASSTFGVYICLDCAGGQRRLGTHVSFVRSVDMDEWTPEQLESMKLGGNKKARVYFREHGVSDLHQRQDTKYNSTTARHYKSQLQRSVSQSLTSSSSAQRSRIVSHEKKSDPKKNDESRCGLDQLADEFSEKFHTNDMGSRALSAPELSRATQVSSTTSTPAISPVKEELKNLSYTTANNDTKISTTLLAAPAKKTTTTLAAGAMLGNGNATTVKTGSARRGIARKPRGLGARRLDGDVIIKDAPLPPRHQDSTKPPSPPQETSSRLAALNSEINAPPQPVAPRASTTNGSVRNGTNGKNNSHSTPPANDASVTVRFADKKGFGSDAFFDREPSPDNGAPSASRFAGQSGIGSDAFFDDQQSDDVASQLKGVLSSTLDRFVR